MIRKEMIKKHLLTRSVMLVLVLISMLNIYGTTNTKTGAKPLPLSLRTSKFIFIASKRAVAYNFASEALPVNDAKVNYKLFKTLRKHDFRNVQSNILHRKAEKWFPVIEPILKFYGIPDDFKYIPLVESGFTSGKSPKGANGIWQFMPGTARTYGLRVGHGTDERLNLRKSTIAACKYIKELYGEFNSWTLAAAAYNNGSIKLARAINRQNEDNYFRMKLNRETGSYVYKLIAMKAVIEQPKEHGYQNYFFLPPAPQLLAFN
ncbi:transglycosylase SLT domain-containing protein [Mucilaginibacter sp. CAU 1740]|uniref:transglycosylase SLT domain-containing protein n=1 Tax=Mucilaginibacter sp. CAU 1740 TaxID=3140365 RepID=UPI00325AAB8D